MIEYQNCQGCYFYICFSRHILKKLLGVRSFNCVCSFFRMLAFLSQNSHFFNKLSVFTMVFWKNLFSLQFFDEISFLPTFCSFFGKVYIFFAIICWIWHVFCKLLMEFAYFWYLLTKFMCFSWFFVCSSMF